VALGWQPAAVRNPATFSALAILRSRESVLECAQSSAAFADHHSLAKNSKRSCFRADLKVKTKLAG